MAASVDAGPPLRFPLYLRILGWLFLNVMLMAAMLFLVVVLQFGGRFDALIGGLAGDKLNAITGVIYAKLAGAPKTDWETILASAQVNQPVRLILAQVDGQIIAGPPMELPPEVLKPLRELPPPPRHGDGPPDRAGDRISGRMDRFHSFSARSSHPAKYWIGFHLPPLPEAGQPEPFALLIESGSITGGGLFFDVKPWVVAGIVAVLLSALLWVPFVHGITARIRELMRAAGKIAEGRFDVRVAEKRGDELGRLGAEVNRMAAQLDGVVTGQKRFMSDVAHELCSPLARMQVAVGILEQQGAPVERLREEVEEMSALVNELLSFSRASLRRADVPLKEVPLRPLAETVAARESGGSAEVRVKIPEGLAVIADRALLQRALANVVRNAVRYAAQAGPIEISAERKGAETRVIVRDCGPGVPEEALSRLFDPFFRVDASRTRETGGTGLGLAIVKTCMESCGGSVRCRNRKPAGLKVTLVLRSAGEGSHS